MLKKSTAILLPFLFAGCALLQLWLTGFIYSKTINQWFILYLSAKTAIWFCGVLILLYQIYRWRKYAMHQTFLNPKLLILTVVFTLWTVELIFSFIPASETTESSLGNYTWIQYFRKPINEQGFRDESWQSKNLKASHRIVFIGDSYTEGFGLKDTAERFSNIVANHLGDNWAFYNMGRKSASTSEELKVLYQIPFKPDILVWQYLFNDAEDVCETVLKIFPDVNVYSGIHPLTKWVIKRSYLINKFYFRFKKFPLFNSYNRFFLDCAQNKEAMQKHYMQLDSIADYCKQNNVLLIPVIVPYMNSLDIFSEMSDLALHHFRQIGHPPVLMYEAAQQTPVGMRSVSAIDAHPSKHFSKIIADSIFNRIKESTLLSD